MKNIFKKEIKKIDKAGNPFNKEAAGWWNNLIELFKKDTKLKEEDPEFNTQNIYRHWIKSYLGK